MPQIIIRGVRWKAACPFVLVSALAARADAADATDRLTRTLAWRPGAVIRVEATIADLTIVGSDRSDVAVEIVRRAPTAADFTKYQPVVESSAGAVRIVVQQSPDGRDPALQSTIVVRAPSSAVFEVIRVFEGRIRLTSLSASCDVDIRRGPIEASGLAGRIRLETGIGAMDVRDSTLTSGGMMRLRVFNGPLRVRLARLPANARILAVTFNGTITSEIPLTMKDKFGPRFGETTIGSGDPVMSIDVVKGDIAIGVDKRQE